MKEKIIKFIIVALVVFFSASMACADTPKYPYVERVEEVDYKIQPFESNDTIIGEKKNNVIDDKAKEKDQLLKAVLKVVLFWLLLFVIILFLFFLRLVLLLLAKLQFKIAKKR